MEGRVIRKGDSGHWEIRTTDFEVTPERERNELKEHLDEIRMSYHIVDGDVLIDGGLAWSDVDERMKHFYDGWAEFTPF